MVDTRRFISDSMYKNASGDALTTFILQDQDVAGSVGVIHFNRDHKTCEIGYWLRQELQGQGIMTKACRCLIDHIFRTKSMNRIEIRVATGNVKSRNVPLRLGFAHEGTLRQAIYMYKEFRDIDLFSLLRTEWEKWPA